MPAKQTKEEFIIKSIRVHGDKYDYSNVEYNNNHTEINIICKEHGNFTQTPQGHLSGRGCKKCSGKYKYSTEEWIIMAKEMHGDKYDYSKSIYNFSKANVIIICKKHGEFQQKPNGHLQGKGCIKCGGCNLKTTDEFIKQATRVHGDKYDYSKTIYTIAKNKIIITCKKCGDFEQNPNLHLKDCGCNKCCNSKKYSKEQIKWLNFIQIKDNIFIEHAENSKEFIVPTTRYRADGWCRETNTIYEYHGSYWHGDPKWFNAIALNKVTHCTFGELYEKTMQKEKTIKELGYNLVVMWESDWNKINKSIRSLQRKFRSNHL